MDMTAMVLQGEAQRAGRISLAGYTIEVRRAGPPNDSRVAILVIQEGPDQFLVAGIGASQVTFSPSSEGAPIAGIASIDEETFINGEWVWQRRLNGDEDGQGKLLRVNADGPDKSSVYRVRLYRY
ncbi:MAG TPA: DUF5597 domain-containing protein [Terriglobales bacterium]